LTDSIILSANKLVKRLGTRDPFQLSEKLGVIVRFTSLYRIFDNFHDVVKQLCTRHDNRPTLSIDDEYDVQDLLHALLKLYFKDIRDEEPVPNFAGASARIDFLLKNEQIGIEVKNKRDSMTSGLLSSKLYQKFSYVRRMLVCIG